MSDRDGLTTGDMASLAGIPQQTLIAWDRAGILRAGRGRRGASARSRRRYDEDALAAALMARAASRMGFKGRDLKQMIGLVQKGNQNALEAAAIFTYRTGPGLMAHHFSLEIEGEDDQRWVRFLREKGFLIDGPTTLWEIREQHLLPMARGLIRTGSKDLADKVMMEGLPNE